MKRVLFFLFCFVLLSKAYSQDELLGFGTFEPPCPEGAGYIEPGWLGDDNPLKTGCVWKEIPEHLRIPDRLFCILNSDFEFFEVWSECNPAIDPLCPANCGNLEIIDGIATSPPSLAASGTNLRGTDVFGEIQDFATNQRVINQVIASCGFEGEFHYAQTLPTPTPEPTPPPPGPRCDDIDGFVDGPGGDLWKPRSDNTGRPVVLVEPEQANAQCEVFAPDGSLLLNCSHRTCCPNGNRAHFDIPVSCERIPAGSTFRLTKNDVATCWPVLNRDNDPTSTCERLD